MDAVLERSAEEVRRLQRCINDLTGLLALPAVWTGREPSQITRILIDALVGMLRLDFVYVRFTEAATEASIEMVRGNSPDIRPGDVNRAFQQWLDKEPLEWPRLVKNPFGTGNLSILPVRLGLNDRLGLMIAAAQRPEFPEKTEKLILSVAANQTAVALEEARRFGEQRHLAIDLDQRVAQRTHELAQSNEALKREIAERANAEKALSASERNLQLTIDTIPALVWATGADGSAEFFNEHYVDYVGRPVEQLRGWGWTAVVHPDDIGRLEEVWRRVMASGTGGEAEARFRRSDGEYRWLVNRVSPLRNQHGEIIRWYGINFDIEDRKRAESHLTGEKHVLEMIAAGRSLRDVLAALCEFFEQVAPDCHCGIYPLDWRGETIQYGVAPSLPPSYTAPIEGASIGSDDSPRGQSIATKSQVVSEDLGSDSRWATAPCRSHVLQHGLRAVWSTPICSRQGTVIGTVCVYQQKPGGPTSRHQEIIAHATHIASIAIERALAEQELRRSEFYLTQGQRVSETGTFSWWADTDEITFSEELFRIFEFEPNTAVTVDLVRERSHPDDRPKMIANIARLRAGHDFDEYQTRLVMPDGRIKYVWLFARVRRHEDGRLECLGAMQDITRRRVAEEARDKVRSELAHVSRVVSLGALTASIAHEVNQPLASIVTNGETGLRWLARPNPDLDKVQQLLVRVVTDARRAADIIDRMRTMARRGTPKPSNIALSEIVRESTAFLHHEFESRGVSIVLDCSSDLPKVMGDQTQLQQVVVNLVMNAIQALTKWETSNRSVAIRTRQVGANAVCCIIEDSGPGIDADHLPQLFDSFFTTKDTGMGLGLPIARSIIEAHDGRIRADNNSSLGGARFIFELPGCSQAA